MNKIEEISKQYEDHFDSDVKNTVFKGLTILGKYSDDLSINPAHDELFAGFDDMEEKMSEEDIHEMFKLNWHWSEDSWAIFT